MQSSPCRRIQHLFHDGYTCAHRINTLNSAFLQFLAEYLFRTRYNNSGLLLCKWSSFIALADFLLASICRINNSFASQPSLFILLYYASTLWLHNGESGFCGFFVHHQPFCHLGPPLPEPDNELPNILASVWIIMDGPFVQSFICVFPAFI